MRLPPSSNSSSPSTATWRSRSMWTCYQMVSLTLRHARYHHPYSIADEDSVVDAVVRLAGIIRSSSGPLSLAYLESPLRSSSSSSLKKEGYAMLLAGRHPVLEDAWRRTIWATTAEPMRFRLYSTVSSSLPDFSINGGGRTSWD